MNRIVAAAVELQDFLQTQQAKFCVIGGLAVLYWGQPRTTEDVDVSLFVPLGEESEQIDRLLSNFRARIPDAREFALENRVLLIEASNGIPLDIALAAFPFEEEIVSRSKSCELVRDVFLRIVSLEDLLVLKSFAGRPQDWIDVEGILVRRAGKVQWRQVISDLSAICSLVESNESLERLSEIRQRVAGTSQADGMT